MLDCSGGRVARNDYRLLRKAQPYFATVNEFDFIGELSILEKSVA
jgi:hypothetical protein